MAGYRAKFYSACFIARDEVEVNKHANKQKKNEANIAPLILADITLVFTCVKLLNELKRKLI